tara:strand:+ start:2029 stop:3069 length:1041 start_codon:yes stop_codon:yes gene_type:complete
MSFFNKKEEVLQIKLTQYGKHLLSKGKFKPTYYAFFDDSVLYNSEWAQFSEKQSEAEGRIQEDTPSLKVQHIYAGAETNIKKLTTSANVLKYWEKDLPYPQHTEDRHYSFSSAPLGTTTYGSTKAPAYLVNFLIGEMTGSSYYMTGSHQTLKIPQLDVDIVYETSITFDEDAPSYSLRGPAGIDLGGSFPDGSRLNVKEKHILLEIVENNTDFSNENFDIEVFLMEEEEVKNYRTPSIANPGKKYNLTPLSFVKPKYKIVNNILLDPDEENSADNQNLDLDSSYIGHYFDVFVDKEIDTNVMCSAITADRAEEMYDEIGFECPEGGVGITEEDFSAFNTDDQEVCE